MRRFLLRVAVAILSLGTQIPATAEDLYEAAPIEYSASTPDNPISRLATRLEAGETSLKSDETFGYLPQLLKELDIPVESQMLVFSQTSLQRHRISPRTPRALYFNDDVYVGYCQDGDVIEISTADPQLGTVFYTLDQKSPTAPRFERQVDSCLACHSSSRTEGVPGHVVRSLFVDEAGQPHFSAGSHSVDHTTPLKDRWGGWYVTGTHGDQTHLGNLIVRERNVPREIDNSAGHNVVSLEGRFDFGEYLTPHSDLAALMVLEHQTFVHNRITRANFTARQALHYQRELNEALGEPADRPLESTTRRIQNAGDDLVEALLMVDEAPLTAPLKGTSGFAEQFSQRGPFDSQGRSLRQLDLERRLLTYPCSWLVYSESFRKLPDAMRDYVWQRLWEVLAENADAETFAHLSADDRTAILEILRETHPDAAAWPVGQLEADAEDRKTASGAAEEGSE